MSKIPGFRSGKVWKMIIAVIGYLFILAIVVSIFKGNGSDSASAPAPAPAPASNTPAPVNATATAPTPAPAPKPAVVELSKEGISSDVKVAVIGFDSKNSIGDNEYSAAKSQGVFKIISISLTNNQKDAITIDSNNFKLFDDQGREFSYSSEAQVAMMSSMGSKQESFFLKKLNPGMTIDGQIVFDVPKDAKGFVLKARGGMTGKEITLKVE